MTKKGLRKHKRAMEAGRAVRKHIRATIAEHGIRPPGIKGGLRGVRKKSHK